jgi:hypothetical protein
LPFNELINTADGTVKSDKELSEIFLKTGIDTTLPVINSCGSGVTACVNDLGLRLIGAEKSIVFDGSWTEYVSISIFVNLSSCRVRLKSQTSQILTGTLPVSQSDDLDYYQSFVKCLFKCLTVISTA